jgi:hypothetical protein
MNTAGCRLQIGLCPNNSAGRAVLKTEELIAGGGKCDNCQNVQAFWEWFVRTKYI